MGYDLQVFTGNTNKPLTEEICAVLGVTLGASIVDRFPGGEIQVQLLDNVRGNDVYVIQPVCAAGETISPNDAMMELPILLDAARRASARRITAVLPYYGYARQDRKASPRVPITAKLVSNLLVTAGARRVLALDLHANQIQSFFDIPVDHLYSINLFGEYLLKKRMKDLVVVSPDIGGLKMARPTIHVTAMTRRKSPILHLAYQGAPPHETDVLTAVGKESEILRTITLPGVKAVHLTEGGCGILHAVVSIEKLYEGYGKMVGLAVLGCPSGRHLKQVTVVDDDVDPFDPVAVEWAVATRVQPHRDVEIFKEVTGIFLDPSLPPAEQAGPARTSKILIDATRYDAKNFPSVCLPSAEAVEKVKKEWHRYGIPEPK